MPMSVPMMMLLLPVIVMLMMLVLLMIMAFDAINSGGLSESSEATLGAFPGGFLGASRNSA